MKSWLRGKGTPLAVFLGIAVLVTGGLGWATAEVLRLESEQMRDRARAEIDAKVRLALWRLDSRVSPAMIKEDGRPYHHYSAFYAIQNAFDTKGNPLPQGTVIEPSPLLSAELPDWMLLHFQTDPDQGIKDMKDRWGSPQVLENQLKDVLLNPKTSAALDNCTPERQKLLDNMAGCWSSDTLVKQVQERNLLWALAEQTVVLARDGTSVVSQPSSPNQTAPNPQPVNPTNQPQTQTYNDQAQSGNNYQNINPFLQTGQQRGAPGQSAQQLELNGNKSQNDKEALARYVQMERSKRELQKQVQLDDLVVALINVRRNGGDWFTRNSSRPVRSQETTVWLGPMVPVWVKPAGSAESLVVARMVQIGDKQICQGIVLDWLRLQTILHSEIEDLFPADKFPEIELKPVMDPEWPHQEGTMTALPIQLEPGPTPVPEHPRWTALRVGLALAWAAALVALGAVGLGGWSLLELSERRIRFVSAVTHELRTPLTTQRLYLDMLTTGLVQDEKQKAEYLQTLHTETERLNRLVANVLDFSRLERQRPRLELSSIAPAQVLEQVRSNWEGRCQSADKELVVVDAVPPELALRTDVKLVEQVLGNLIDNACKYSQGAADRRIWLRASAQAKSIVLEVEDRGPGVPAGERRAIFHPFRRGRDAEVTAGGVGLGLALARKWASLLGGTLSVAPAGESTGACFRLELPR